MFHRNTCTFQFVRQFLPSKDLAYMKDEQTEPLLSKKVDLNFSREENGGSDFQCMITKVRGDQLSCHWWR